MTARVLVAGIGNIFLGDDGFGVEVLRRLADVAWPPSVTLMDVGTGGVHLAYELMEGYDAAVLVDAAPHGAVPGTVSVIEPTVTGDADGRVRMDAHGMTPADVLAVLATVRASVPTVRLVACEPAVLEEGIGLSPAVEGAVPAAVAEVGALVGELVGDAAGGVGAGA